MMNMMNMMKQAQNIQKKLVDAQNELTNMSIEGSAGNGSVSVICDGKGQFKSIKLSAEAINPENPALISADDIEMLEDLISSAMKIAIDKSKTEMEAIINGDHGNVFSVLENYVCSSTESVCFALDECVNAAVVIGYGKAVKVYRNRTVVTAQSRPKVCVVRSALLSCVIRTKQYYGINSCG